MTGMDTDAAAMTDPVESLARTIAETAHDGQVDKAGEPYIGHCERVVARLEDPLDRAVAWLHDVVEDTGATLSDIFYAPADHDVEMSTAVWTDVVGNVDLLTHRPHEPRADYYERIRGSTRAVRVKLADIADNSDPERLAVLDDATRERLTNKYAKARKALGVSAVPAPEGDDHQEEK